MYVYAGAGVGLVGTPSAYMYIFIYAKALFLLTFLMRVYFVVS